MEILHGQLKDLSKSWCKHLQGLSEQKQVVSRGTDRQALSSIRDTSMSTKDDSSCQQDALGGRHSEHSGSSTTACSPSIGSRIPEIRQSLLVKLRYGAISIANQDHLRQLAKASLEHECSADCSADWSVAPTIDFLGIVPQLTEKLAERHQTYLARNLLPYLRRKKILKIVVLAVILGFWEVVRVLPDGYKIKELLPKLIRRLRGIGIGLSKTEPQFSSETPYDDIWIEEIGIRDGCQVISRR
jgi:hypothetical protein